MNKVRYTDKAGQKRWGIMTCCKQCDKAFPTRISKPAKYCSAQCANKSKQTKVTVQCSWCSQDFFRRPSRLDNKVSKSGLYFCCRKCKDEAQKLGGIEEIMPPHYGTGTPHYRELFSEEELICARCGYDEFKSCVDIHHIDGNRKNNDESNLIPLCSNCHCAYHRNCIDIEEIKQLKGGLTER